MKIVLIGAEGTVGKAVKAELAMRHEIISVGKSRGDLQVDMTSTASIESLFKDVDKFDALVITAGNIHFEELQKMSEEQFLIGIQNKLMGQVNCTRLALPHLSDNGSITLTSGILSHAPIFKGSSAACVNGAINSFVIGAAIELPRSIRINAVSPTILEESMPKFAPFFRGFVPVKADKVALSYSKSVEGRQTGQIYDAH